MKSFNIRYFVKEGIKNILRNKAVSFNSIITISLALLVFSIFLMISSNIRFVIANWEETAELVEVPPAPTGPIAGTDITKELPEGDPATGEAISISLACTACHVDAPTGPFWPASEDSPGIGDRAATRITQPDYSGEASTADQYLFESIVNPSIHLVTGYADGLMPNTYGSTLTDQEMADLIAYMLSIK